MGKIWNKINDKKKFHHKQDTLSYMIKRLTNTTHM